MESDSVQIGRARHRRIYIILNVGCAMYVRALIEKHVNDLKPPSNLDKFLEQTKDKIESKRKLNPLEKKLLYPPCNGCTDIQKWDLTLLTMVYLDCCNPSSSELRTDMRVLRDRRNTLSHNAECILSEDDYTDNLDAIEAISKRCLKKVRNSELTDEVNAFFTDDHKFCLDRLRELTNDLATKLSHYDEEDADDNELLSDILDILKQLCPERNDGNIPEIPLLIKVKNVLGEKDKDISEKLLEYIKPKCNAIPKEHMDTFEEAVHDAVNKWTSEDVEVESAERKCVLLTLRCHSIQGLATLWQQFVKGHITESFQPLQTYLRTITGCENVVIEVNLPEYEIRQCINALVEGIAAHVSDSYKSCLNSEKSAPMNESENPETVLCKLDAGSRKAVSGPDMVRFNELEISPITESNIHQKAPKDSPRDVEIMVDSSASATKANKRACVRSSSMTETEIHEMVKCIDI